MAEMAQSAPLHRWERFGLRWEYECRRPRGRRWGVSDGCLGVEGHRDPLRAYLALRQWRKVQAAVLSPADRAPSPDTAADRSET